MSAVTCVSVTGCHAGLALLERLAFPAQDLPASLPRLRARAGVSQLAVLSTCQRVEVYAASSQPYDPRLLVRALGAERGVPAHALDPAVDVRTGPEAVQHLLRVTSGLASFVLGEREIVGQVRAAAQASRVAGVAGPELNRLLAAAVSASRRVHRETSFAAAGRSVAGAAVDAVLARRGTDLSGFRLLVVGAGQVATVVVERAVRAGAEVTVANRTLRRAERLRAAGAQVVDLAEVDGLLRTVDAAIVATAAPHHLVDAASVRGPRARPLLLLDLCLPRNVDPAVREVEDVELVDLHDLGQAAAAGPGSLVSDLDTAERLVREEAARYLRWLQTRTAAHQVRRLRADADAVARDEARRLAGRLPQDVQAVLEEALLRTARRLAHGPTVTLLSAAENGDDHLVTLLSGLFEGARSDLAAAGARTAPPSSAMDDDTAGAA
jgi:glutamyl-tRNA reductase